LGDCEEKVVYYAQAVKAGSSSMKENVFTTDMEALEAHNDLRITF
jgi:hypothetical protein